MHKNEDKTFNSKYLSEAKLNSRLEAQIDRTWIAVVADATVYVLTEPAELSSELRQMTRWPEDWKLGTSWWETQWVVCWVPRLQRKAQIRIEDITYVQN